MLHACFRVMLARLAFCDWNAAALQHWTFFFLVKSLRDPLVTFSSISPTWHHASPNMYCFRHLYFPPFRTQNHTTEFGCRSWHCTQRVTVGSCVAKHVLLSPLVLSALEMPWFARFRLEPVKTIRNASNTATNACLVPSFARFSCANP